MSENFYAVLRSGFADALDRVAVETVSAADGGRRRCYAYGEIEAISARLANLLRALELPPGARVAVRVEKSVEALCVFLATLRAGYVYLPLNTAYQKAELEYFLGDARPALVVIDPSAEAMLGPLIDAIGARRLTLDAEARGSLFDAAASQPPRQEPAAVRADEVALILYTSGTTGRSKGAMLTHGNLAANARVLHHYWQWSSTDVLIHALPIFHIHGLFVAACGALLAGARMIWFDRFDPLRVIERLPEATLFMGVPTLYTRMLAEPALDRSAARSMRLFVSGSAPLLPETHAAWRERTGHVILERYGMSETGMLTSNPYGPDPRYGGACERRAGSVGFPLPGVELRVRMPDGRLAGVDEIGEVEVRGPNVFKGYWGMPDKTAEAFTSEGFFRTGDVGRIDAQGYLWLVGRARDLFISGGYNVYPAEVESYLNALPGVAESAVVGVAHPDFGEVGVAYVVARPGASLEPEALLAALRHTIAHYKVPKRCFVLEALPRNAMGKVQKNLLRERAATLFA
ncbi:MAG: malonyl-CoA synthase [Burkholderiales bacterium]|nr:malonyl-CoA synthase [Burkholderiales bacterium]